MRGSFTYTFPAIEGRQAGRVFYVAMCPLHLIPRIFLYDEDELPAEFRAQRPLNRSRIPAIARYMLDNPREYVFSSITASVDGKVDFLPSATVPTVGTVEIPMSARFIINDGQHRRAGIEAALKENPDLSEETISVVLFVDGGLRRSQQMFADLNQFATRPSKGIGILYDLRSPLAQLARTLVSEVEVFRMLTETERSGISPRSLKLFTLSSLYQGTKALLGKKRNDLITKNDGSLAVAFWTEVAKQIPEWKLAAKRQVQSAELRREFVHAHGIALHALGLMGSDLIAAHPQNWRQSLRCLKKVDWSRKNVAVWEGRAMVDGRISKANAHVKRTAALLKTTVGLPLHKNEAVLISEIKGAR